MNKKAKISIIITTALIVLLSAILGIYFGVFYKGKYKSIFKMTEEEIQYNYKGKITDLTVRIIDNPIDVSQFKYVKMNVKLDYKNKIFQDWSCFRQLGRKNSNKDYKYELLAIEIVNKANNKTIEKLDYDKNNSIFSLNKIIYVENIDEIMFKATYSEIDWKKYFDVAKELLDNSEPFKTSTELANSSIIAQKGARLRLPLLKYWEEEKRISFTGSYAISK